MKDGQLSFYDFNESLSSFGPERLGLLDDFLFGTLNPLIGLCTILHTLITLEKSKKPLSQALMTESYCRNKIREKVQMETEI